MNRVNAALVQYSSGTIIPQTHGPADRAKSIPRVYGSKNKDAAFVTLYVISKLMCSIFIDTNLNSK